MNDTLHIHANKTDRLLRPEDAAIMLGPEGSPMPLATLQWWRWKRRGPRYVKIGRHVFYRESAILDFIRSGEVDMREAAYV